MALNVKKSIFFIDYTKHLEKEGSAEGESRGEKEEESSKLELILEITFPTNIM